MSNQLTAPERSDLRQHEAVIEKGLATFIDVGQSLQAIQAAKLYREKYETFDQYIKQRWDREKRWAYQLIEAVEVQQSVGMCAMAHKITNERQLRELAKVPDEHREQVLEKVVETVGDEPVTASVIKQTAAEFFADDDPEEPEIKDEPAVVAEWPMLRKAAIDHAKRAMWNIDSLSDQRPFETRELLVNDCLEIIKELEALK